jgi:tripartite-type tricarboxylate transporter receptor subunit TctC
MINRRTFTKYAVALSAGSLTGFSHANQWPQPGRTIKLVVPFAPGGTTDILGRLIAEGLAKELQTTVVVENMPGANGNLGAAAVVRAKPDGYTLMLGTPGPMIVNKYVYDKLAYDPLTDIAPIALVADLPNVLMVRPDLGVNTVTELVELAKKRNGALSHGSPGMGSSGHVSTELFKLAAGIKGTHIPYKGSIPMLTDLIGGSTDFTIDQISSALKFIQTGKLKALAVTSKGRSPELPNIPTLMESNFPNYDVSVWFCIATSAKVPKDAIAQLNAAINKILAYPEVRARIASFSAQPLGGTPEDLTRQIQAEQKNILLVIKAVDLKV